MAMSTVDSNVIDLIKMAGDRDMTERKQAKKALPRLNQRLKTLQDINRAILKAESSQEIAHAALSRMSRLIPYQEAAVVLYNFETGEALVLAGTIDNQPAGTTVSMNDILSTEVLRQQEQICYVKDIAALEYRTILLERQLSQGLHSFLAISSLIEENLMSELYLFAPQLAAFNLEHQAIAREVANQLAVAIQQAQLWEQLQRYAAELEQRVTQRTAALVEANQELEVFTHTVSHDLQAPLRTIQGFTELLLKKYNDRIDANGQNYIQTILNSVQKLNTLISDLLDYSQMSRVTVNLREVELSTVINTALALLDFDLQARNAIVRVTPPLPKVTAHFAMLMQAIANLISNAIKYVAPNVQPEVHIYAQTTQERVRLWIEDNGIGIHPRNQERIFRPFERLGLSKIYPGTGMGLAIVRRAVERCEGSVGVISTIGEGSRFWIELPQSEHNQGL
ncbi:MAG: hypothetical protein HC862_17040 [Scytonema sp. RU_4_4]|nr:hypothetical protein [Scytonema sp. RU_4_4]NJR72860.1 hypothetical protein [Scytonema sp. CRU_2_7]